MIVEELAPEILIDAGEEVQTAALEPAEWNNDTRLMWWSSYTTPWM